MKFDSELMLKPVLIGGVIGGVLSAIPIISCLNCCCLLYAGSGAITAYLIAQKTMSLEMEDYALAGAGSGAIAGLINGILGLVIGTALNASLMPLIGMPSDMATQNMVGSMVGGVISIPVYIVLGAIFGAIGAIIYIKLKE
ncbi:hypothetical protein [Methanococcus aeolicus]|uniref:Uncharacterized protein n=1 Tax=Methanococcus aeolicus (strain ATCC BAA-1280 / DSM 17508 / OCM 812 / Nankai-3) TaxID=419665 RepID=A6UW17_META3|nr:hypothetical protein [Methanococcus aeolicus]ABR56689.1 conserved hypothetical protein [Methanococcus aeolicus Nankai-3]UXM84690.1 hypothetical protein N6C89_08130 [Methanococcus aeolicus]